MQRKAPLVVVLGTGGTIAGRAATPESLAYASAQIDVADLAASAAQSGRALGPVRIETEQVAQIDSKDMDFATWRRLALAVERHAARPEVRGIVVTHGTDTLEETAFFLACVVAAAKPVVLTAAMRPATSFEADGPRNLADAIAVAASETNTDDAPGVVVAFAGEIHAARDVRKAHPRRLDAFTSGERGAIGRVVDGRVESLRRAPDVARLVDAESLPEDAAAWPWVEIVTSDAGADGRVVDMLVAQGVAGIVVAATGNGSLHRALERALADAVACGVVVRRASRVLDGSIVEESDVENGR
ncbi:MAG: asparaginase, partial [Caldimonas sp.]